MGEAEEKFERIRRAHSRLHDPEVAESSVMLVPVEADVEGRLPAPSEPAWRQSSLWKVLRLTSRRDAAAAWPASKEAFDGVASSADAAEPQGRRETLSALFARLSAVEPGPADGGARGGDAAPPQMKPDVRAAARLLECEVDLLPSCSFTLAAPAAEVVRLVWGPSGAAPARRVLMEGVGAGRYRTTVSLDEGEYLFAYEVDGALLPPCTHAQRLRLRGEGIFARLEQRRPRLTLSLTNGGEGEEVVVLKGEEPWLAGGLMTLAPKCTATVALGVLPQHLKPGPNLGGMRVSVRRGDELKEVAVVRVRVEGVSRGVVPSLECGPPEAEEVRRGGGEFCFTATVAAKGRGTLSGLLLLPQTGDQVDFRIEEVRGEATFSHRFSVPAERLPPRRAGTLKVMLATDSYLADRRVLQAEVPYRAVYLKKSLPALLFGRLERDATRSLHLAVRRSDGGSVDLQASVPAHAAGYLTAARAAANAYSFRLDAGRVPDAGVCNVVVTLTDKSSGLQDRIKVIADLAGV